MSARSPCAGLDASTPMATPSGWQALGELQVGEEVFSADGLPCRVVGFMDRPPAASEALEIRLCDGTATVCGAEQPWLVDRDGSAELILAEELRRSLRSGSAPRYSIALPASLEHRYAELSVDPYELGARLGSGLLEDAVGIPRPYLQADVLQRRDLLMGLLDEGGGVSSDGAVHFDTVHLRLARDVRELVASLGHRVTIGSGGGSCGSYRRVSFRTCEQVFGLRAPGEQLRERSAGKAPNCRWIVDVSEAGGRRMRAIEVAAEGHVFVAGENLMLAPDTAFAKSTPLKFRVEEPAVPA